MIRNIVLLVVLAFSYCILAQDTNSTNQTAPADPERWNLYFQTTSIGQTHGTFNSPYQAAFSFLDEREHDASVTTTLFFGTRLTDNLQFYFDPELAGGRGLSSVNGIANAPNGEMPRILTATPKPYRPPLCLL